MMSPNEYDVMVEHLANEIVEDVMEKEAAPRQKRIEGYEAAMKGSHNRKLIDAQFDREDSRIRRAQLRAEIKKAKRHDDPDAEEKARLEMAKEKQKKWKSIKTQLNPMNNLRASYERLQHLTPSMLLPTAGNTYDAFTGKQKALRDIAAERAQKTASYEDAIMGYALEKEASQDPTPRKVKRWENFGKELGPQGYYGQKRTAKGIIKDNWKAVKKHPYATGATAVALASGATLAALKAKKKKEEEKKDKVAEYYDDAMLKIAAAENVYDYADYHDDEYEALLMKEAAEEVYEDAMAQAEAAENVYDAIEAGAFDDYDDADYDDYDDADYDDYDYE